MPPEELCSDEWNKETINAVVSQNTGWAKKTRDFLKRLDCSLLVACVHRRQNSPIGEIKFHNLFALAVFLIRAAVAAQPRNVGRITRAIAALGMGRSLAAASEDEDLNYLVEYLRFTFTRLSQLLGNKREKRKFLAKLKADLHEFVCVLRRKEACKSNIDLRSFLLSRMKEQLWFSPNIWQKMHYFEAFAEKFVGYNKLTYALIEHTKLHIALSLDGIGYSKCAAEGDGWNVIVVLERQFGISAKEAGKVLSEMLADTKQRIEEEMKSLTESAAPGLSRYKNTAIRKLFEYCLDSISAPVVWGAKSDYFRVDG
ncbi:hypothetical protein MHBO_000952 [Bonamia ostreae]|uniref:Uncharacterized protein n=1 Tax=Bonamia ostreae TaxID=126728 RepID=A0ABV2AHD0_9EUKA